MKFVLILSIILMFSTNIVFSETILKGTISYTVAQAREIAFEKVPMKIDMKKYKNYLIDKNWKKNQTLISNKQFRYKNRSLVIFSDNSYAVNYNKNKNIYYYYSSTGKLKMIEYEDRQTYPSKSIRYNANGLLDSVSLNVSESNEFLFTAQKKLYAHWIGEKCYNEYGEIVQKRSLP